jgi:hypothetical protein
MSRLDFGRIPIASDPLDDTIYLPSIPEGSYVDENSPLAETEVQFNEDPNARHRSIYFDFHEQDRELEIVAGFCSIHREILNSALAEARSVHGEVRTLAVTMAIKNARVHALFFVQHGFKRAADRSRTTWTYEIDLEEHRLRKQPRRIPKPSKAEQPKPAEDLRPTMTIDEFQRKTQLLQELRERIQKLQNEPSVEGRGWKNGSSKEDVSEAERERSQRP